jgi:sugar/nucleoside kinase (ribokinase family)
VVGNLTTDLIIDALPAMPEWGREQVGSGHRSVPAGEAAYLAVGLSRLGHAVRVVGVVGEDAEGAAIRDLLASSGIDVGAVGTSTALPTAISVALVRADGERAFVSDFACQLLLDADFVERHLSGLERSRALCVVGLFNLPALTPAAVRPLFSAARAVGVPTVLDTGWDPAQWPRSTIAATHRLLVETDLFLPNLDEATALTGEGDPEAAAIALQRHGVGTVVVKCGADGSLGRRGDRTEQAPAWSVDVRDAVGAGDAFDAAFLSAQLGGAGLGESLAFGNAAAAIYVSRVTDRHPTEQDVREVLAGTRGGTV